MRLTITLVFLLTLFGLNAAEQKILDVQTTGMGRSKEMKSTVIIKAENSTAEAVALIMKHSKDKPEKYSVAALKEGIVLKEHKGMNVLTLSSDDFATDRGGHLNIKYLADGMKKQYGTREFKVELTKDTWKVYSSGREVKKLDFKIKRLPVIGPVGIEKIVVGH